MSIVASSPAQPASYVISQIVPRLATGVVVERVESRPHLPTTEIDWPARIITVGDVAATRARGDLDFWAETHRQAARFEPVLRRADDAFLLMFTSGTTGPAKALEVPLEALCPFAAYMRFAIDLRPEDRFWNIADPGWAYGLYYALPESKPGEARTIRVELTPEALKGLPKARVRARTGYLVPARVE